MSVEVDIHVLPERRNGSMLVDVSDKKISDSPEEKDTLNLPDCPSLGDIVCFEDLEFVVVKRKFRYGGVTLVVKKV